MMAIASPSRFSKKKLARLFEHELAHIRGKEHADMSEGVYWSKGDEPEWARGKRVEWKRKGESVLPR